MKIQYSVLINRPIEEVFAFVTNLENETRWQPEIKSVTLDGPLQTGGTFRETRVTFGRRYDWHFRITQFQPPFHITIETISGTTPYSGSRIFEAVNGSTRVTERGELKTSGLLCLFDPILAHLSQKPLQKAYNRLKVLLETEETQQKIKKGVSLDDTPSS